MVRISTAAAILVLALAAASQAVADPQLPWRAPLSELQRLRDDTSAALQDAFEILVDRTRVAKRKDLVARLFDVADEPLPRGYGILPEITDGTSRRPPKLSEERYSIEKLLDGARNVADQARSFAGERAAATSEGLEELVVEYEKLGARLQKLDRRIAYHEYWQEAVVDHPAFFRERNRVVALVRKLQQARERGETGFEVSALEQKIRARVAPFVPTDGLEIVTRRGGRCVLPVSLVTDITDRKFLKQFRRSVSRHFSRSAAARALNFRIELDIRTLPPAELYPQGTPRDGEAIDLEAHLQRFAPGSMVLTTGAASTHAWQGRSVAFGPAPIHRHALAHEFGHLLGFSDGYLRGFEGYPGDPFGIVLVEWSGVLDDMMGDTEAGEVSEEMILTLLRHYAPSGRSLPCGR